MNFWDDAYETIPPWDVGHPQPAFVKLVRAGELRPGRVLDVGCGTGENALFLSENGFSATGIDLAKNALEKAQAKALERCLKADFRYENALSTSFKNGYFDDVIDSGLFHTFSDEDRPMFASEIARVLTEGGKYFMLCFSEKEPSGWGGPRRVNKEEIERSFSKRLKINYIRDELFTTRIHENGGKAYLTSATKNSAKLA